MPKLKNRMPRMCRMKSGKNTYAVINFEGKKTVLGKWKSKEAEDAYNDFIGNITKAPDNQNAAPAQTSQIDLPKDGFLVSELAVIP